MPEIVVATRNQGKLIEIRKILGDLVGAQHAAPLRMLSLSDFPQVGDIPEDGVTFEENALSKAKTVARLTEKIALADDSGIAVDALGGKPGVMSARFAGIGATDERNNAKLLEEMTGIPLERRGATFVCVMAAVSGDRELLVRGECRGVILEEYRGKMGFGYDPLFLYPPMNKTYSEMTADEKNSISHRGRALAMLAEKLPGFLAMERI